MTIADIPPEWRALNVEDDWELTAIVKALVQGEPNASKLKGVLILPMRESNAFVSKDGFIIITEGLLEQLEGREEIAFVIAHELAHLLKGHPRHLEKDPTILERIRTEVERRMGTSIVGTGLQMLLGVTTSYYTREKEREADAEAVRLMAKAGFDPMAGKRALRRLGDEKGFLSWFRSHPFLAERLDIIQENARRWLVKLPSVPPIIPPPDLPQEVFVQLHVELLPKGTREAQRLWKELTTEAGQWLWGALMDVTKQGTYPFRPARRWQRHRAIVFSLQVTPIDWQISPLPNMDGWTQWQVRMLWQLQDSHGKAIETSADERIGSVFNTIEPMSEAILSHAPTLARRLAKFIVQTLQSRWQNISYDERCGGEEGGDFGQQRNYCAGARHHGKRR